MTGRLHFVTALNRRLRTVTSAGLLCLALTFQSGSVAAQDVNAGRLVYVTPQVSGQLSCSAGSCHTPNPLLNQNRILKGADDPGAIGLAVSTVAQMAFLRGRLTTQQFVDLAAYIGNPGAATGTPAAQVAPTSIVFPDTQVGSSAAARQFAITNTGTATLVVSNVTSSRPDFSLVSTCGSIAANASCNVSVGFSPSAAGAVSGTITVSHNATGGSSTVAVSGNGIQPVAQPAIQVSPATLAFGPIAVGSFSGTQTITVSSIGTAPLTITGLSDVSPAFSRAGGTCTVGVAIAPGSNCTLLIRFAPTVLGLADKVLSLTHNAGTSAATVALSGTGTVGSSITTKTMVEYLYAPLNYFFITSRDSDKELLDKVPDFQRTGLSFPVYAAEVVGSKGISRFYFDKVAVRGTRGSHFYSLLDSDKAALAALNPTNAQTPGLPFNEGIDSWAFLPVVSGPGGSCASGLTPVYRLFRNNTRFPDDPNHRFTTSLTIYNAFVAQGWDGEGVNFCVPSP
jgi:Abnormal spindle-like microcephaly-assoc'd, ASPM-SPD-2-Hydin